MGSVIFKTSEFPKSRSIARDSRRGLSYVKSVGADQVRFKIFVFGYRCRADSMLCPSVTRVVCTLLKTGGVRHRNDRVIGLFAYQAASLWEGDVISIQVALPRQDEEGGQTSRNYEIFGTLVEFILCLSLGLRVRLSPLGRACGARSRL
jgi:hypothetical protein